MPIIPASGASTSSSTSASTASTSMPLSLQPLDGTGSSLFLPTGSANVTLAASNINRGLSAGSARNQPNPNMNSTTTVASRNISNVDENPSNSISGPKVNPKQDNTSNQQTGKEIEYYPRSKRAPYLYDISDFGIRPSRHSILSGDAGMGEGGFDPHSTSENEALDAGGLGGMTGGGAGAASSTSLASMSQQAMKRRSSFSRMFATLGMSPGKSDLGGDGAAGTGPSFNVGMGIGGGDDGVGVMQSHTDDNETPNTRYGRISSTNLSSPVSASLSNRMARRGSIDSHYQPLGVGGGPASVSLSTRDRAGSYMSFGGGVSMAKYPRWVLNDASSIIMRDGMPVPLGTIVHHHHLLSLSSNQPNFSMQTPPLQVTPTWRLKERMKTVGVCLILALNIGTDPPDINKPSPCAKLQCWLDPTSISRAKAKERIGERLEQQYARWQQRSKLKYRRALDPTVDTVQELCYRMRESAKGERVLLHYNGHGVPRPTANGEIWLFDKHHTQYIPLSVTDLRRWIGKPSIVVLDCSGAGVLMPFFTTPLNGSGGSGHGVGGASGVEDEAAANPVGNRAFNRDNSTHTESVEAGDLPTSAEYLRAVRDTIVLCPTAPGEWLPLNPEFPADIFTSCLTTPIPIALRWFVYQNPLSMEFIDLETIADAIPGKLNDRKTPLGELNWIFTAITDTIAWNVLPSPLFQRLFRQDLLVASMFRNFLLADRILRCLNCSPMSYPELPSTCHHPLWMAWDLAVETCLNHLMDEGFLRKKGSASSSAAAGTPGRDDGECLDSSSSTQNGQTNAPPTQIVASTNNDATTVTCSVNAPFFAEQLTAFQIYLEFASSKPHLQIRCPPYIIGGTTLPFLNRSLSREEATRASYELEPPEQLPIVLQVLLSQAHRVRALVLLRRFLDLGPSAVNLALSVGIFPYVLKLLQSPIDEYKHVLIGIWSKVIGFDPSCQVDVVKDRALPHFIRHLRWGLAPNSNNSGSLATPPRSNQKSPALASLEDASEQRTMAAFILSVICSGYGLGQSECINEKLHMQCGSILQSLESLDSDERHEAEKDIAPQFRMWLCICLGNLVKDNVSAQSALYVSGLHFRLFARLEDDSPDVRTASCYALGCLIGSAPPKSHADDIKLQFIGQHQQPNQLDNRQHQHIEEPQHLQQNLHQPIYTPTFRHAVNVIPGKDSNLSLNPGPSLAPTNTGRDTVLLPSFDTKIALQGQNYGMHQTDFRSQIGTSLSDKFPPTMRSEFPSQLGAPVHHNLNSVPGVVNLTPADPSLFGSNTSVPTYQQQEAKSVFEDEQRMDLDASVAIKLSEVLSDASPVVRFEAGISLSRFVGKYLSAFVSVAGKTIGGSLQGRNILGGSMPSIPLPNGVGLDTEKKFSQVWTNLFHLQRTDPYPSVRLLVNSIVVVVSELAMAEKMKLRKLKAIGRRRSYCVGASGLPVEEQEADKDYDGTDVPTLGRRSTTGINLSAIGSPPPNLKRTGSVGTNTYIIGSPGPLTEAGHMNLGPAAASQEKEYTCLESKFYDWKKVEFLNREDSSGSSLDPLSDKGAIIKYRSTRNAVVYQKGKLLKDTFATLAQKPAMRATRSPFDYDKDWERGEGDAAAGIESETDLKKHALQLNQVSLLRNSGVRTTSMLRFHPFEPALVVCGGPDIVSVWNAESSERMMSFPNGNPKNSRMTSASWINEDSMSLLLLGSSDGSVRIWDGLFESNDEISREKPSMVSSFFAAPDVVSDQRFSSGLVLEFQQYGGQLIAGGSTKLIRCWDVATEKCRNSFPSKSDASLTALTTAWNYDFDGGYSGLGPDIIVAGYGNGSLRVFDTRMKEGKSSSLSEGGGQRSSVQKRRWKYSEYDEHSSWILDVSFANHEIVSGCVGGRVKLWDLRYSSSMRTLDYKMQTTALSVHSNIPMFAAGSPAQFIKIMTHDGTTQQVIRYHEKIAGKRIGPVSCLEFHPHMPFLAAGFADEHVSIYGPSTVV